MTPMVNVFLDMVAWEARGQFKGGVCLDNCTMQLLMFANDTVLLAEMEKTCNTMLESSVKQ